MGAKGITTTCYTLVFGYRPRRAYTNQESLPSWGFLVLLNMPTLANWSFTMDMESLTEFELEVLENLPVEPVGLMLTELADELLHDCSPKGKGKIKDALLNIAAALGGLYRAYRPEGCGGLLRIWVCGIPRAKMPAVRRFFAEKQKKQAQNV